MVEISSIKLISSINFLPPLGTSRSPLGLPWGAVKLKSKTISITNIIEITNTTKLSSNVADVVPYYTAPQRFK